MNLKELRKAKGLSQNEASEICSIPLRTYKRIENDDEYKDSPKYLYCFECVKGYSPRKHKTKKYNDQIVVVGAGYVGLSLAILLSQSASVALLDVNEDKVKQLQNRISPIKDSLIDKTLKEAKLNLAVDLPNNNYYKNADYVFLALPTDLDVNTGLFNVNVLNSVINEIRSVNKTCVIVIKSTVGIGYTESLNDDNIIFCPEFLREGNALYDLINPSRIIIGATKLTPKIKHISTILTTNTINNPPIIYMSPSEAEAVKLFSNTYLAMRISFFNEVDSYLLSKGLDAKKVISGIGLDQRIGSYYNNPSFGYGGYCLPKDTQVLSNIVSENHNSDLITSIAKSNRSRKENIANEIAEYAINKTSKSVNKIVIGVYSYSSKSGSDNSRFAALRDVTEILKAKGFNIEEYKSGPIDAFYEKSDVILSNRYSDTPKELHNKVYTRDIFLNN